MINIPVSTASFKESQIQERALASTITYKWEVVSMPVTKGRIPQGILDKEVHQ
jgi:hypothetical protein